MQKLWKKLAVVAATVCLATGGVFCIVGCNNEGTNGTAYQYKTSYTDTYNLYDDGTYIRSYEGEPYIGTVALEIGTYKISGSTVSFTGKSEFGEGESWPSNVSTSRYHLPTYSGTLNKSLIVDYKTYQEHGSVTKDVMLAQLSRSRVYREHETATTYKND